MIALRDWKMRVLVGMTAAALLFSVAAFLALMGQVGPLMWTPMLGLAKSHDELAFGRLKTAATSEAARTGAEEEIHRALALSPYDNEARLRLVYIDSLRHPPVGAVGVARFEESYSLIPYDYTIAAWRIRFGLEHWGALSPVSRAAVYEEAMAFGRAHSQDVAVRGILQSIHDPQGRLAAALWLQLLNL
jgi:hypothetical protein